MMGITNLKSIFNAYKKRKIDLSKEEINLILDKWNYNPEELIKETVKKLITYEAYHKIEKENKSKEDKAHKKFKAISDEIDLDEVYIDMELKNIPDEIEEIIASFIEELCIRFDLIDLVFRRELDPKDEGYININMLLRTGEENPLPFLKNMPGFFEDYKLNLDMKHHKKLIKLRVNVDEKRNG